MTEKSLDGEEVREVSVVLDSDELLEEETTLEEADVVLKSDELVDSTMRLEEDVELLRLGGELELDRLLVKKVDDVDVVVFVWGSVDDEVMGIKLELELELEEMTEELLEVVVVVVVW
jgi:hypothetical protein